MNSILARLLGAVALMAITSAASAGDNLDRIMKDGVLRVATDANWAPQSFINEKNELDGFDVNVAQELSKRMGLKKVEFVTPDWTIITAGHWSGRWDVSVGSMSPTKDRTKVLTFPAVYYYTPASFAVHKDSTAANKADLNGKKIGVTTNSTFEQYLQGDLTTVSEGAPPFTYDVKPSSILSLKDSSAVMDDLRLGAGVRMDAMLGSLPAISEAIKNGYPVRVVGTPAFYEPLAIAIDKGDEELNVKIATIIKDMQADGTLSALSVKWYGVDYTTVIK